MDMEGLKISPPPADKINHLFYKMRLSTLKKYDSNDKSYIKTIDTLSLYVNPIVFHKYAREWFNNVK